MIGAVSDQWSPVIHGPFKPYFLAAYLFLFDVSF